MKFTEAAKLLSEEMSALGYVCRLDPQHPHPRLYIGYGGKERFVTLSTTQNYDHGNRLAIKRQDIRRDVLPNLPKPVVEQPNKKPNGEHAVDEPEEKKLSDLRSYPIKVYLASKNNSTFVVLVPRNVIPEDRPNVELFLSANRCLGLIFVAEGGKEHSASQKPDTEAYYFQRDQVPFKYANHTPPDYSYPQIFARMQENALVTIEPLPDEILVGVPKEEKPTSGGEEHSINDGINLVKMLNDWITWATTRGHEPQVTVERNRVAIEITERVTRKL